MREKNIIFASLSHYEGVSKRRGILQVIEKSRLKGKVVKVLFFCIYELNHLKVKVKVKVIDTLTNPLKSVHYQVSTVSNIKVNC